MKVRGLIAVGALLVSSGAPAGILEKGLDGLKGRPIEQAVAVLGYPSAAIPVGPDIVYRWDNHASLSMPTFEYEAQKTRDGYTSYSPKAGTEDIETQCDIQLVVGADKLIREWHRQMNLGACGRFKRAFKKAALPPSTP